MTMTVVIGLAVVTVLEKGVGTLLPPLPAGVRRRLEALAPALLAALVVTEILDAEGRPKLDAEVAAVAVAGVLAWRRAPLLVTVVAGAAVAAAIRAA